MATQHLPCCPGGGAGLEDITGTGKRARAVEVSGQSDARAGQRRAPALGARP
jgi:hypothetical protein